MTCDKDTIEFGPKPIHPNFKDVTGYQYGRLAVIGFSRRHSRKTFWHCQCECGIVLEVAASYLQSGKTRSCGCLRIEVSTQRATTHGMRHTPEYRSYIHAKDRCNRHNDPRYADYGGRGIEFRFTSFEHFHEHLGDRPSPHHSLDRFPNNDGHYEPGNVRWATRTQQARNTRSNRHITYNGQTKLLIEWSRETGVSPGLFIHRLKSGWSIEKALTVPPRPGGR